MLLDIIYLVIVIIAFKRGLKRGFVRGLFSFVAFWIGLVVAIKLSILFSRLMKQFISLNDIWLSFFSFIIIFLFFSSLIKRIGKYIHNKTNLVAPSFINSISGGIFYLIIYTMIFCVFLIYLYHIKALGLEMLFASKTYKLIFPQIIKMLKLIGKIIPIFKNIFA